MAVDDVERSPALARYHWERMYSLPRHVELSGRVYPGLTHSVSEPELDDVRVFLNLPAGLSESQILATRADAPGSRGAGGHPR